MHTAAYVTLAIGEPHIANWQRYCSASWQSYAARHGLDLIVVTQPFEQSSRSPAWQKCLVLNQEFAANYRQVVLLDADIAINPGSPNIVEQVSEEYVGGVISGSQIHDDLKPILLSRLTKKSVPYERGSRQWQVDQGRSYEGYGLTPQAVGIIQTGVLVASPKNHGSIFRSIYDGTYRETRCYEQIPLSHTLIGGGIFSRSTRDSTARSMKHCWCITTTCLPILLARTSRAPWCVPN